MTRDLFLLLIAAPLLALAVYRVWRLLAKDFILEPIRSRFIFREGRAWAWISDLLQCAWCLGFWLSGVACLVFLLVTDLSLWWLALIWPAVSALVGITSWFDPDED